MKIIILLFLLSIFNAPPPDQECISDWVVIWEFPEHRYCNEQNPFGDYSLYTCEIIKPSEWWGEYKTQKLESQCVYDEIVLPVEEMLMSFLPIVTTGCPEGAWLTDGYCTIIGDPIRVP